MAIVDAKCTNCGKTISVDNKQDADLCPHCGHAFVTKKAIKLYRITPIEGENKSAKVKRFFKMLGSALLLILECIWTLICTLLFVDFISDITKGSKK